mmetsp:Transcript_23114/g.57907  ORF Transcript_23114/g.57907 Transcript_23114/m.57907 type:complete len:227 (-) Transcript_23114:2119-2799(-)
MVEKPHCNILHRFHRALKVVNIPWLEVSRDCTQCCDFLLEFRNISLLFFGSNLRISRKAALYLPSPAFATFAPPLQIVLGRSHLHPSTKEPMAVSIRVPFAAYSQILRLLQQQQARVEQVKLMRLHLLLAEIFEFLDLPVVLQVRKDVRRILLLKRGAHQIRASHQLPPPRCNCSAQVVVRLLGKVGGGQKLADAGPKAPDDGLEGGGRRSKLPAALGGVEVGSNG